MKTTKLIELERSRIALIDDARGALADIGSNTDYSRTDELERAHQKAMRALDENALDIDAEKIAAVEEGERFSKLPIPDGEARGVSDNAADYRAKQGWTDKDGKAVRVLSRAEPMAERSGENLSLGDLVRAKITGARTEAEKRALSEGNDSAGGFTVPTPLSAEFIDRLRAESVAIRAGAMTVPFESQTLAMARLASDPDVAWRAENTALAEGDPTFDRVTFEAKTLAGMIRISRELAEDSINVGQMIETAFAGAMATKLDYAAIYGDGSANSPTGVVNTAGINSVSMATNGGALANYDKSIDAIYEMHANNGGDPSAQIMHPRSLASLAKLKDGNGNPLTVPEMVANVPMLHTTSAPIDETQGTASNASSIVFGDFRRLMIGIRSSVEIRVYDQPLASTGQLLIAAWMRADAQVSQPKCFTQLKGITP